jgi:type I restriction enzyme S subunit
MSETLEQMARALFKAWFVDFEPVRAKCRGDLDGRPRWQRGQSLPGLPAHLYDLFPDRLVDSELGEIPEGWRVGCVDDVFDLTMGQSPPGETYNEVGEGIPFYQGRADFTFRFPERRVYCTAPTRFAKKGDTLISVRAPVGAINMALEDCAIGRGVAAARHKTGAKSYTYYFMQGQADEFSRFESEGTVFGSISKKDFHAIQCVIVPSKIVEAFEQLCEPIDDRIEAAELESRTLAALRDTLLPKLISGELRVRDAGRFLKERGL